MGGSETNMGLKIESLCRFFSDFFHFLIDIV